MSGWNRTLALVGCTLIAAACTQDTTTAPPAAADVAAEGGASAYNLEGGTITFVQSRGYSGTYCDVKIALNNLNTADTYLQSYRLMVSSSGIPVGGSDWVATIARADISRNGTYRYTPSELVSVGWVQSKHLILGWTSGDPLLSGHYGIGNFFYDAVAGVWYFSNQYPERFKVVNRCF